MAKLARKLRKRPTDAEVEALYERREKLQESIDDFCRLAKVYLPATGHDTPIGLSDEWEDMAGPQSFDEDDVEDGHVDLPEVLDVPPAEEQKIPLPSSYGREACSGYLSFLAAIELGLRRAQATDALHNLRLLIAQKSFAFRYDVRKSTTNANYKKRLRSRDSINSLSALIDLSAKVYTSARRAMCTLGASQDVLERYQVLQPQHLQASTAVVDFNASGQRNQGMSWIWHSHQPSASDPSWLRECRVHHYNLDLRPF